MRRQNLTPCLNILPGKISEKKSPSVQPGLLKKNRNEPDGISEDKVDEDRECNIQVAMQLILGRWETQQLVKDSSNADTKHQHTAKDGHGYTRGGSYEQGSAGQMIRFTVIFHSLGGKFTVRVTEFDNLPGAERTQTTMRTILIKFGSSLRRWVSKQGKIE
ncbi:hypothetical protein B0H19DRAFT_1078039 [Mycena capillaripes]|nr:hypothetical protein B0H19DRAFT_1078039 [Mycena capillaripes]